MLLRNALCMAQGVLITCHVNSLQHADNTEAGSH
jgi:hypothetical protein